MQSASPSYHSDISDESSYCLLIDWLSVLVAAGQKRKLMKFQHEKTPFWLVNVIMIYR